MSKQNNQRLVGIARFDDWPKAAWRRWFLCAVFAAIMLFAGALSPQPSQGAYPKPLRPVQDGGFATEGGGCGLHCTTPNTQLVYTSGNVCAICCYTNFPYTCSSETCCP